MPDATSPIITRSQPLLAAVIRLSIPREQIGEVMGPGITEVMRTAAVQAVGPVGAWFTHHLRMDPEVFDFEIGVPVARPIEPMGRVIRGSLPGVMVARAMYEGAYDGLGRAWGELNAWIEANGHTPREDFWECYVAGPEISDDPSQWRTELNRPLTDG